MIAISAEEFYLDFSKTFFFQFLLKPMNINFIFRWNLLTEKTFWQKFVPVAEDGRRNFGS